jgi:hypothetical protein
MRTRAFCLVCLPLGFVLSLAWARTGRAEVTHEGKILLVRGDMGTEPQLTTADGKRWLLSGLLKEELLRLDGHKLRAWGVPGAKKLEMPTLEVSRYDIIDSGGGKRPHVGLLHRAASGLVLQRKDGALEVQGSKVMIDTLEKRLGCKVWVVGDLEGRGVKVFKFGWLSCKKTGR